MSRVGIYNLRITGGGGGEKRTLALAEHLSRKYDVFLITGENYAPAALHDYFQVDLTHVEVVRLPAPISAPFRWFSSGALLENIQRLREIRHLPSIRTLDLDVFINNNWASTLPCPARRGVYMCMFPHRSWLFGMPGTTLDSYSVIAANSEFTRSWVKKLWGRDAAVTYSAGEPMGPPGTKERIILHVGRFVDEARADNKHQRILLETFQQLDDLHVEGWHLHFAGTVLPDRKAKKMAAELVRMAQGYPVVFHFNAPFDELRDLYRRASLYWHATGFGWPVDRHPERQEHFGITTVEAMSAGAVPVVVNTGGQRETVTHGASGFLWDKLDELCEYSQRLARDAVLRQRLGEEAVRASARFSREAFVNRVEILIEGLLG